MKNWLTLDADVNCIMKKHFTRGRGGKSIEFVGIHYDYGNPTVEEVYGWWQEREASAHYQVEDGGRIGQLVWDANTAWALGNFDANQRSINIEHANRSDGTVSEACLDNGAHLTAAICKYYGLGRPEWLKNVFPHKYFSSTSCPGQLYGSQKQAYIERAQYWYDQMCGTAQESTNAGSGSTSGSGGVDIDALAREVINGKYGNGEARKAALGSNYAAVQKRVNEMLGAPSSSSSSSSSSVDIDALARAVINGDYGNGETRKKKLGSLYSAVQKRVNEMLR